MTLLRVLQTTQTTLSRTFTVDEAPTDAAAGVTVAVKRLDGTSVLTGSATHPGATGLYTFVLTGGPTSPASATWQLDTLTVDWTGSVGGATITVRDEVEVVGGFLFGIPELRAKYRGLADVNRYTTAALTAERIGVEQECERICRQAFVPRFAREVLSGRGTPYLGTGGVPPNSMIRRVRAVSIAGVALSAPDVALIGFSDSGIFTRPGGAIWPAGVGNIVIEYEHGLDQPPEGIRSASMLRCRTRVLRPDSAVPDKSAYTAEYGGSVYRLVAPGAQTTGVPDVDGDYERYTRQRRAAVA